MQTGQSERQKKLTTRLSPSDLSQAATQPGARAGHPHGPNLPLRVGTRGSPLALWQTRTFLSIISGFCPVLRHVEAFEEHVISVSGDRIQDKRLAEIGGKGLFSKEIHEALLDRRVDFAVHSLKDLETELPPGIVLACTLKREDARDALIINPAATHDLDPADPWAGLPTGALVGTSSVRRQAQMLAVRPDLRVGLIRGNVQTRLSKVKGGEVAATMLALAGLKRMELAHEATVVLDPDAMVPAAGQGIVGVTVREDDAELRELLAAIEDREALAVSTAERALLAHLDGSCRTPIGGHARLLPDGELHLTGLVARADGSFLLKRTAVGSAKDAARLGSELGESLRRDSPADIFA
jgi:hydroxymethylbilane synthase